DFVSKPKVDLAATLSDHGEELRAKIKSAARARVRAYTGPATRPAAAAGPGPSHSADAVLSKGASASRHFRTTDRIIAIGASTGGTEAI
ncbi:hypothetical protein ACI4B7_27495, partial [Klebsiella pneumoniae]